MYINRAILLVLGALLIFLPSIEEWALHSTGGWHRPYQLWLVAIVASYWNQRNRQPDEF